MKVYVTYDEVYEEIIQVHKSEESAKEKCEKQKKEKVKRYLDIYEYELEEQFFVCLFYVIFF